MRKKILVTGGTGYIGSHTIVTLQQQGYEVLIADNLSNSFEWIVDHIYKITGQKPIFYKLDLTDKERVNQLFKEHQDMVGVIHFAALKAVGESVKDPLFYYHNNINSLLNILSNMKQYQIPYLVFSSSCTVYGEPEKLPVTEQSPILPPMSPYGYTKQVSEQIIRDFTAISQTKAVLLRYFNPIGAHESALIGELPIGVPTNLIPFITQTAIGIREKLNVFGDDYDTPDGTCIRDYIHVVDLAEAHLAALNRLESKESDWNVEVFNVGTGHGFSVMEIIQTFEKVTHQKLNYQIVGRREGDIAKIWADTSYSESLLNWKTKRTLDEMLLSAWNWQLKLKELNIK